MPRARPKAAPDGETAVTFKPDQKTEVASARPQHAGGKVTVACKVPNGIIIRAFEWNEEDVPVFGGGVKREQVARPTGEQIKINGPAYPFGTLPRWRIIAGYAMTEGVDVDLWKIWLQQNKKSALVTGNQINAFEKTADAEAWAKECRGVRSGLEPINPGTVKDKKGREIPADLRMPRGGPHITGAVADDSMSDVLGAA